MRLYQETYFPLLYFYVMSAQTHFIVNGNWYSFHLNVSDIVHMCSSVTQEYEEQCSKSLFIKHTTISFNLPKTMCPDYGSSRTSQKGLN